MPRWQALVQQLSQNGVYDRIFEFARRQLVTQLQLAVLAPREQPQRGRVRLLVDFLAVACFSLRIQLA
jgi:hypothetical protein